jgi:hypothetical protein
MGQDGLEGSLPDNFDDFFAGPTLQAGGRAFSPTLRSQRRNADWNCNERAEMACFAK